MVDEYNLQIKIRNNYLLQAMKMRGFESVAECAREIGISRVIIDEYLRLLKSPIGKNGDVLPGAKMLCEKLGFLLEELFPPQHLHDPLKTSTVSCTISADDIQRGLGLAAPTPMASLIYEQAENAVFDALIQLTGREREVLRLRFGIGGREHTLEEIGKMFDVNRERIRQIEAKALRKLRRPSYSDKLGAHLDALRDVDNEIAENVAADFNEM